MSSSYKIITQPTTEPVTITEVKALLRIPWSDDDAILGLLISRARAICETFTHRALAYQQIQEIFAIDRPTGGELSGPILRGPSWYEFNESLGANPFGPAQYYMDLALPPVDSTTALTIETKVVAFDPWTIFPQQTNADGSTNTWVDDSQQPARIYISNPIVANFYRFTFWAGFGTGNVNFPIIPPDLKQCILEATCWLYDHREAETLPEALRYKLLAHRVDWL